MRILFFVIIFLFNIRLLADNLPPINIKYCSMILSDDNNILGYLGETKRIKINSLTEVTKELINCLIATEDRNFYNHNGVSLKSLGRAALSTITGNRQGGSTITMQLCKNLFLSNEKTIQRKYNEIMLSIELEKKYSKDEILLLYLNTVYWGRNVYGLWAAAREYFNKFPSELSLLESAFLVGLLKGPSYYEPIKNYQRALGRRNEVLHNLLEVNKLDLKTYNKLIKEPIKLNLFKPISGHFNELIRRKSQEILKEKNWSFENQLKIKTTLNYNIQLLSNKSVENRYNNLSKELKELQVGLVILNNKSGKILSMIGGNPNSDASGINRAFQIKRQVGSLLKPFIYAKMLQQGYSLGFPIPDSNITYFKGTNYEWNPKNYYNKNENAFVTMKYALAKSINTSAAYSIMNYISPEKLVEFLKQLDFQSNLNPYPSIALGAVESNPLEMAKIYSVFANQGLLNQPYYIENISDETGNIIYRNKKTTMEVLDQETSYLITDALKAVVDSGTGNLIRKYYQGIIAGKTGTTNDNTDAWFVGYNRDYTIAIWLGYDIPKKTFGDLKINGGSIAAPLFGILLNELKANRILKNDLDFDIPSGISFEKVCIDNGMPEKYTKNCTKSSIFPINDKIKNYKSRNYEP